MSEYDRGVRFNDLSLDKLKAERKVIAITKELHKAYGVKIKMLEDHIKMLEKFAKISLDEILGLNREIDRLKNDKST